MSPTPRVQSASGPPKARSDGGPVQAAEARQGRAASSSAEAADLEKKGASGLRRGSSGSREAQVLEPRRTRARSSSAEVEGAAQLGPGAGHKRSGSAGPQAAKPSSSKAGARAQQQQQQQQQGEDVEAEDEGQLQELYSFAERFHLLLYKPDNLPPRQGSSRAAVLDYLRRYLGEAPEPQEGDKWGESMAQLFSWAKGVEVYAYEAEECFSEAPGGGVEMNEQKLRGLDLFPRLWTVPYTLEEVCNAQKTAIEAKARAAATPKPAALLGQKQQPQQQQAAAAVAPSAAAGGAARSDAVRGASSSGQLEPCDKLRYRLLMHIATSSEAVEVSELLDRFEEEEGKQATVVRNELKKLVAAGQVQQQGKGKKEKYLATEDGKAALQGCRELLLECARGERGSEDVDKELSWKGRKGKGYFDENCKWYKASIQDFDGWRHLVTYEDGDQHWQNLSEDQADGHFVLEPEEQQQGGAVGAPAGLRKNRSAPSSPKARAAPPKRKREGDGQQTADTAAAGDAGAPAAALPIAAAENTMYAGDFDINSAEGEGAQLAQERGPDHPPAKKQQTSARGRKAAAGERAGDAQAAAEPPGNTGPQGCTISLRNRRGSEPEAAAQPAGQAQAAAASQPAPSAAAQAQSAAAADASDGVPGQGRRRKKTMTKAHMNRRPSGVAPKLMSMVKGSRDSADVPAVGTSGPQTSHEPADQQPTRGQKRERRQQQQQKEEEQQQEGEQQQQRHGEQRARPAIKTAGRRVKEEPAEQEPVSPRRMSPRHQQLPPPPQEARVAGTKRKPAAAAAEPTVPEQPSSTAKPEPAAASRAAIRPRSGSSKAARGSQAAGPEAAAAGFDAEGREAAGAAVPGEAPGAVRSSRRRSAVASYKEDSEEEPHAADDDDEGLKQQPAPKAKQQREQGKGGGAPRGKSAGAAAAGKGGSSRAAAEPAGAEQPGGAEAPECGAPKVAGAAQSRRRAPGKAAQGQAAEAPAAGGAVPDAVMASPGVLAAGLTGRLRRSVNYDEDSEAEAEEQQKRPPSRQKQQQAQQEGGAAPRRKPAKTAAAAAAAAAPQEAGSRPAAAAADQSGAPEVPPRVQPGAAPLSKQDCYWWRGRTGEAAEMVPYWRSGPGAKVVEREKSLPLDQKTTKSCHDCQGQHYIWLCKREDCVNTYCVRCTSRYDYLFEGGHEADLQKFCQGWCPCCIGICLRVKCLRNTLVELGQPPAEVPVGHDQETLLALHAAFQLAEPAMRIYQENAAEAQRQGMKLEDVPRVDVGIYDGKRLPGSERMLCNRCATTIENAHYHCASCQEDLCLTCTGELQGQKPGPVLCTGCGKSTKLQQVFGREQVQRLAASVQRLRRVYEAGPLGPVLQELYKPQQRLWYVEGEPLAEREMKLQRQQQQQQQQPGGGSKAAQPQRGKKRQGTPAAAEGAAGLANGVAAAPADQGGAGPAGPAASAAAGRSESQEASSAQVSGEVGSNGGLDGGKRQRKRTEKAAASVEQEALFKGGVAHAVAVVAGQQQPRPQQPSNGVAHGAVLELPQLAPEDASFLERHRLAVPSPSSPEMTRWWEREHLRGWVSQEDLRLAAQRPGGVQNVIWTPHVSIFAEGSPHRGEAVRLFTERWLLGEPVVVRGFKGRMDWTPATMERVTRDMSNKSGAKVVDLHILDCKKFSPSSIKVLEFFKLYRQCSGAQQGPDNKPLPMYKLKDWPVDATFAEKLGRHNDDFLGLLNSSCVPVYTHPTSQATGVLNLANHLPWYALKPDLGPKGYIAYGREAEHEGEGDSVTKLHEDLSEAINILCHVQLPPGVDPPKPRSGSEQMWDPQHYGYAGAVWDVFRREDRPALERFLLDCVRGKRPDLPPFVHQGRRLTEEDVYHVMHAQCFMLTERHRQALREKYGVHPWHFEQFGWEGVFVPGGTPHQVRNLRSCTKIALDFVTPEALGECMRLREDFRHLVVSDPHREEDPGSYHYADRLQVRNMVLSGLEWALEELEEREAQFQRQAAAPEQQQ